MTTFIPHSPEPDRRKKISAPDLVAALEILEYQRRFAVHLVTVIEATACFHELTGFEVAQVLRRLGDHYAGDVSFTLSPE